MFVYVCSLPRSCLCGSSGKISSLSLLLKKYNGVLSLKILFVLEYPIITEKKFGTCEWRAFCSYNTLSNVQSLCLFIVRYFAVGFKTKTIISNKFLGTVLLLFGIERRNFNFLKLAAAYLVQIFTLRNVFWQPYI